MINSDTDLITVSGPVQRGKEHGTIFILFCALAPEVHLKTYSIIEHSLRLKTKPPKRMMLTALLKHALSQGWIKDSGFRHIKTPSASNDWCKSMIEVIPSLRNSKAHGSTMLVGDCLHHISVCADFINQLFRE